MVMTHILGVESGGAAFGRNLSHQTSMNEIPQVVVRGGS
jgi:hypothetical protein